MWSEKTRLPVRGRRPRTGSLVFQTTSRLEEWFNILYHITGRTPDLKCIFGNHLKPGLSRPVGPIVRPQVCISNTKTPKSVVQILRPQVRRTNTETSGQHFNYWDLRSAIQILSSYQCGGSVPTENIWIISEKWKWNFGNLHLPQLAAGSESERKYLLLLRWKVQKSAMKMWAVSTRKMDNMYMPTSCGFYQGDLGDVGLDLHLSWHAGDHHWNHILPCLVLFYLHHPPFFSCLALIKNFGPSRSKHTTKLTNSILFSWLAWDHWHWEVIFYKCNQCNYKCNFVKNLKTHKNSLYKCIQCNYKCIILGSLRNHNFSQMQPM